MISQNTTPFRRKRLRNLDSSGAAKNDIADKCRKIDNEIFKLPEKEVAFVMQFKNWAESRAMNFIKIYHSKNIRDWQQCAEDIAFNAIIKLCMFRSLPSGGTLKLKDFLLREMRYQLANEAQRHEIAYEMLNGEKENYNLSDAGFGRDKGWLHGRTEQTQENDCDAALFTDKLNRIPSKHREAILAESEGVGLIERARETGVSPLEALEMLRQARDFVDRV